MSKTLTPRVSATQWSSGSDPVGRTDFNNTFANLDAAVALDDGTTGSTLPTSGLIAGRYFRRSFTDGSAVVYRRSASAWEPVGGSVDPIVRRVAPLSGQAVTDTALSIESTLGTPALTVAYSGDLATLGALRSAKLIGSTAAGDTLTAATTGRLYAKTQADGELGIVARAHGAGAGSLFTAREPGGSAVWTVDAAGRMQSRVASAFGGAALPTTAVAAVAPTSAVGDGITDGLLLYGNGPGKGLLALYPDATSASAATSPIARWLPNGASLGALPWGSAGQGDGMLTLAGDLVKFRSLGNNIPGTGRYQTWMAFYFADQTTPSDPTKDQVYMSWGPNGFVPRIPLFMQHDISPNTASLTVARASSSGNFLSFIGLTGSYPNYGFSGQCMTVDGAGRMSSGVPWRTNAPLRDTRQPIVHKSVKIWASEGDSVTAGQAVARVSSFTYTFGSMTTRSATATDLAVEVIAELMNGASSVSNSHDDGQQYTITASISLDGGSTFNNLDSSPNSNAQASSVAGFRLVGDAFVAKFEAFSVAAAQSFIVRLKLTTGDGGPTVYIRKYYLRVAEVLCETYSAP